MPEPAQAPGRPISAPRTPLPVIATDGPRWQCVACEMLQFPRAACNRCGKPFKAWALCLAKTIEVEVAQPKTEQVEPEKLTPPPKKLGRPRKPEPTLDDLASIRPLADIQKEAIINALTVFRNCGKAAIALGVSRSTIHRHFETGSVPRPDWLQRDVTHARKLLAKGNSTPKL